MAKFKKGESGNPAGRPRGTKNKTTKEGKLFILEFLQDDQAQALKDWAKLSPWERWQTRKTMYEFIIPKQRQVQQVVDLSKLSNEEIDILFKQAMESIEDDK